jgi:hypothetical protein
MKDDLIKKLKTAEGPSRELDAFIGLTLKYPSYKLGDTVLNRKPETYMKAWSCLAWNGGGGHYPLAHYTSSIDAALAIVPDEWGCEIFVSPNGEGLADVRKWSPPCIRTGHMSAPNPALAICIAALHAMKGTEAK